MTHFFRNLTRILDNPKASIFVHSKLENKSRQSFQAPYRNAKKVKLKATNVCSKVNGNSSLGTETPDLSHDAAFADKKNINRFGGGASLRKVKIVDVGLHFCQCFSPGLGRFLARRSRLANYLKRLRKHPHSHTTFKAVGDYED